ncbi:MAG: hypothetical protein ACRCX8_08315, partial [Sarcina sp.]
GFPLDNSVVAESFKEELLGKEFKVEYQKGMKITNKVIKINDVKCLGEGLSSFYTIDTDKRLNDTVVIDLGGRTCNVASFVNKRIMDKFTIPMGTIDLFDLVASRWNNLNGDNKVTEEIERLINSGYIEFYVDIREKFLNDVLNVIDKKLDLNTYSVYFTGGGSKILSDNIESLEIKSTVMDNPLFTNVNGNKIIADITWK